MKTTIKETKDNPNCSCNTFVSVVKTALVHQASKINREVLRPLFFKTFKIKKMQPNTTKTRYYQLTAAKFNWEVSEEKQSKHGDLITAFRIPF